MWFLSPAGPPTFFCQNEKNIKKQNENRLTKFLFTSFFVKLRAVSSIIWFSHHGNRRIKFILRFKTVLINGNDNYNLWDEPNNF